MAEDKKINKKGGKCNLSKENSMYQSKEQLELLLEFNSFMAGWKRNSRQGIARNFKCVCMGVGGEKHGRDIYKVPEFNRAIVSIRQIRSATEQKSVNLKKKGWIVIISDFWAI